MQASTASTCRRRLSDAVHSQNSVQASSRVMGTDIRVGSLAAAPMEKFVIEGGVPLSGTVVPAGNKNAALPLLACALLTEERVTLHNVPRIRDTEALLDLLADLGVTVERPEPNTVVSAPPTCTRPRSTPRSPSASAPPSWPPARCWRASAAATMPPPGGDVIGRRRLDPHLDAFRALGATVEHGRDIVIKAPDGGLHAVRLLHGRAVRDGHRERADGRRRDRRHDDHPQRRLRAARAGRRADAQQDGRRDRGHRLQRHARPRRGDARRLRVHRLPRPHRDRLVHGARGRDRRRAADHGLRRRGPADDPDGLPAARPGLLDGGGRHLPRPRRPEAARSSATPATTSPRSRTARGRRSRPTSRRSPSRSRPSPRARS